jgi:hypothetical protein
MISGENLDRYVMVKSMPLDSEHTRLISRLRVPSRPSFWNRLTGVFFEPLEFLITSRMLLGIKKRAEQANELAAGEII